MGLLSKAVSSELPGGEPHPGPAADFGFLASVSGDPPNVDPVQLDEMGKAMAERLLSLVRSETTPETAISLLKAYGPLGAGVCLSLKRGFYSSYASVGIGEAVMISTELLLLDPSQSYYCVDYQPPRGSILSNTKFWAFSLNAGEPENTEFPAHILLVGEDQGHTFRPDQLLALIKMTGEVFLPFVKAPAEPAGLLKRALHVPKEDTALTEALSAGLNKYGALRGIVLQTAPEDGERAEAQFASMVSAFGDVSSLTGGRILILFGGGVDAKLLAHHLNKTGKTLFILEAADTREALNALKPFL
jgi:hypothetical protein